jgi:hypothetical protein
MRDGAIIGGGSSVPPFFFDRFEAITAKRRASAVDSARELHWKITRQICRTIESSMRLLY